MFLAKIRDNCVVPMWAEHEKLDHITHILYEPKAEFDLFIEEKGGEE